MKTVKRILLVLVILFIVALIYNYPKLNIVSGYAAKNMASSVYIAGRTATSIEENDNNVPLIKLAEVDLNNSQKWAEASVFGLMNRKAAYRPGLGCVLLNGNDNPEILSKPNRIQQRLDTVFPFGNGGVKDTVLSGVDYKLLKKAVDGAFENPEVQKTRSILVAYKNQIIAERYTDGFTSETPILGWSMTKSILATLYGILQYRGELSVNESAAVKTWENDDRNNITLNHLLRMQSGLEWDEDYSTISGCHKNAIHGK